ncbi:CubicO group peptidase (beta-lactamase class C family) [Chitinophaga niastensis]|uniref:CubicO group peptidase (Beta-lactamase class C family) n=1 Tax=Chitinophaga niastensis TaxID=536980 RepID=A0A2P8HGT8_CHINA|nr:serine hydrolase domain-containing protein [Chitinophaga niastensis]PSL45425.1 CubicO group peptidase (beta-lactamase class C family) [Chitinophaga niastensis]
MKQLLLLALSVLCYYQSSSQKTINTVKQLTDSIRIIVQEQHIPGLMLGITTKDSVLFSGGFGYADLQTKRPVDNQTLCRLGSITKSFVALGILKLVEQGKLQLNDLLKNIAPDVPFQNQWEADHPVRIINLLEHTTGFDDIKFDNAYTLDKKTYTNKDLILLHKNSMVCRWKPGSRYTYCNVNYIILGYIIKKLTGLEYERYLTEELLLPLGMHNTNFNLWGKYPDKEVKEYADSSGLMKQVPSVTVLFGPAASLWSCADDMVKFLQLFLREGSPILSAAGIHDMETPHSSLAAKAGLKTGYAMANASGHLYYKSLFRGHMGSVGTCSSDYLYSHESGIGLVLSSNGNGGLRSIEDLIIQYFERNKPERILKDEPLDKTTISPYLGYYQYEAPRFDLLTFKDRLIVVKVEIDKDNLYYNFFGRKVKLLQTSSLTFREEGTIAPSVIFTRNEAGKRMVVINDQYCEKVSAVATIDKLSIIAITVILALLSLPLGIVSIIASLAGKLKWRRLPLTLLPVLSVMLLIWGLMNFFNALDANYLAYQLRTIGSRSLAIFTGTLLSGLLATITLVLVVKQFKKWPNRFIKWWLLITAVSIFLITLFLLDYGWIGLRTWAM